MNSKSRRRKLMGEINVVPYIDVMLVLLVIFMITAPLLKEGVKVDLPDAGARPLDPALLAKHEPLILTIDAGGHLYINIGHSPDQPASEATVGARTAAVLRRDPLTPVLVRADTTVPYGVVMRAMTLMQRSGATKLGFLTDPERAPPRKQGGDATNQAVPLPGAPAQGGP
jgi:biopolymer transport protein TolR